MVMFCAGADCEKVLKREFVDKHLPELIEVCHKYEVSHVFPILSALVRSALTVENCCDYFKWAIDFPPVINNGCASYISNFIGQKFVEVVDTDGFMHLAQAYPMKTVKLVRFIMGFKIVKDRSKDIW